MVTLTTPAPTHWPTHRRVEILGVFGSGKTTLARQIRESDAHHLAENHTANPYWGRQDAVKAIGYLPYELTFLTQHAFLVATAPENGVAVCDWSFDTDRLWASMRLGREELATYEATYTTILARLGPPALYLYLRHPPEVIRYRLAKRARQNEEAFREQVDIAYARIEKLVASLPAAQVHVVGDEFDPQALRKLLRD
jgi:deoxyadenosine/deoxycytidine kinase